MMMTVIDESHFVSQVLVFVFFFNMNVLHINKLLEYTYLGSDTAVAQC